MLQLMIRLLLQLPPRNRIDFSLLLNLAFVLLVLMYILLPSFVLLVLMHVLLPSSIGARERYWAAIIIKAVVT